MLDIVSSILKDSETPNRHIPPTLLYNEGWMLRIILHWFSLNHITGNPLSFVNGADWYSEGLLSSQFLPTHRGDELAEAHTRADGIIGNISVGKTGKGDIYLIEPFEQFIVIEAKMGSKLSANTKRAKNYSQVARNIACMANVIKNSKCPISGFKSFGFYVLAPETQIDKSPSFERFMTKESVYESVLSRVLSYNGRSDYPEKRKWFVEYFEPVLTKISLNLISWEKIIEIINKHNSRSSHEIGEFYSKCLQFNVTNL